MRSIFRSKPREPGAPTPGLEQAKVILNLVATLGDGTGIPGLKTAARIVIQIIEVAQVVQVNQADCLAIAERAGQLMEAMIESLRDQSESDIDARLVTDFDRFQEDLKGILNVVEGLANPRLMTKIFKHGEHSLELLNAKEALDQSFKRFQVYNVIALCLGLNRLEHRQNEHADLALLVRAKDCSWNCGERSGCFDGTRIEVQSTIRNWAINVAANASQVFWLNGLAGTGKTAIAQSMACWASEKGTLGASFFCSRDSVDRSNINLIVPSVAFQLSLINAKFRKGVIEALKGNPDVAYSSLSEQFKNLIVNPFAKIDSMCNPLVIILDALDECMDDSTPSKILLILSNNIPLIPLPVKFLITSRPESHIRAAFKSQPFRSLVTTLSLHTIEQAVVNQDIRLFLDAQLAEIGCHRSDLDLSKPWPPPGPVSILVRKASGLFIFASTACKIIRSSGDPAETIEVLANLHSSHHEGREGIDPLYHAVFSNALRNLQEERAVTRFCSVLGTVILVFNPLSLEDIGVFLNLKSHQIRGVLKDVHSILLVPGDDTGAVHAFHASLHDYLIENTRCLDPRLQIRQAGQHLELTLRAFTCMSARLERNICNIEHCRLNSEVKDLDKIIKLQIGGALSYACRYWADHLHLVNLEECDVAGVAKLLRHFAFEQLTYWVEVLSLLGEMGNIISSLQKAQLWLSTLYPAQPDVTELLTDATRTILGFFDAIHCSALQVYYTALPLMPTKGCFRLVYKNQLSQSVQVLKGTREGWSPCMRTIEGHMNSITSVSFSPDGAQIVSGSEDHTVHIWSAGTGHLLATLLGHKDIVNSVAFSHHGGHIASGSSDCTICLWNAGTGEASGIYRGHRAAITAVAFSTDSSRIASGSRDRSVHIWGVVSGKLDFKCDGHTGVVTSVTFSPNNTLIASSCESFSVRLWDAKTGKLHAVLTGHVDSVTSVAFSPDGASVFSGSKDTTIRAWNTTTLKLERTFQGHSGAVTSVAVMVSGDGATVASGSHDRTICIWSIISGDLENTLVGHSDAILAVAFSPDGVCVASGSCDHTIRIWNPKAGHEVDVWEHSDIVLCAQFSPTGENIVVGTVDSSVCVLNTTSGNEETRFKGHFGPVIAVTYSPDGHLIASGSKDNTIRIWDTIGGNSVNILQGHHDSVGALAFSQDGAYIASGSWDNTTRIWNTTNTSLQTMFAGHSKHITSVSLSPDNSCIASGSSDGMVCIWNTTDATLYKTFHCGSGSVMSVSFSQNSTRIAAATSHQIICVWEMGGSMCIAQIATESVPNKVLFDASGKQILTNVGVYNVGSEIMPQILHADSNNTWPRYWLEGEWVVDQRGRRQCWVPEVLRGQDQCSHNHILAIIPASGRILLLDFSLCELGHT